MPEADQEERHFACNEGVCGRCGDDPVVDLRLPLTREVLIEDDDRRRLRRADRIRYGAVPIGIVSIVLLATYVPALNAVFLALPFFAGYALSMIAMAVGVMKAYGALFPYVPRFPYVVDR